MGDRSDGSKVGHRSMNYLIVKTKLIWLGRTRADIESEQHPLATVKLHQWILIQFLSIAAFARTRAQTIMLAGINPAAVCLLGLHNLGTWL